MAKPVLFILAILFCSETLIFARPQRPTYWQLRMRLLAKEQRQSLGGQLKMNPTEMEANKILMEAKTQEILDGSVLSLTIVRAWTRSHAGLRIVRDWPPRR